MKELEEILDKIANTEGFENWEDFSESCWMNGRKNTLGNAFSKSIKECYNKGVTDSARHAEAKAGIFNPEVDKQSILKLLIK